jgi:hypothetical protein
MHNLNPEFNIDIELIQAKTASLNISSETDNIEASRLLGEIDNLLEEITGRRDGIIEEYEKRIEETKAEFSPYVKQLLELKQTVKDKMLYYRELARLKVQEIKNRMQDGRIERSEVFLDDKGKIINESALSIRTENGLSSVRTYYKITVTDFSLVPDAFKTFDKKTALAAVKKGTKEIPGIEIIEKPAMQYRPKKAI